MDKSPRWLGYQGVPVLSVAYSSNLTPLAIFRGIALSMRRAKYPTPPPAMAVMSFSNACWKRKASSSMTGSALTWSGFAGPNRSGEADLLTEGRCLHAPYPYRRSNTSTSCITSETRSIS
jgi:hypothetical protein